MRSGLLFALGWLLLVLPELLRIYFIMPFPGSQLNNTVDIAYFLHSYILFFRIAGIGMIIISFYQLIAKGKWWQKIITVFFAGIAGIVLYMTTQVMQADKMFLVPEHKIFLKASNNSVDLNQLVIGTEINGQSSCYPIQIIGYHHQVNDTVGGVPLLATYCTVCRTGRLYSPLIDGKFQQFRLVGMDNFNAMLEDQITKSWWRQENGEAVAGSQKGKFLTELPSQQMTLRSWIGMHPDTRILQADPDFTSEYATLSGYDEGTIGGNLEGTASTSWQPKSWVIGITSGDSARAYDWIELKNLTPLNDMLNSIPVLIVIEKDMMSFHAWNRSVNGNTLQFNRIDSLNLIYDSKTNSAWNYEGECVAGPLSSYKLLKVPAYQEFWHSWQKFHPKTTKYVGP
ncbi:MAG: DUF3179 domain-containing (seleno)protein [Chitinophagales bacterium]